MQFFVGKDCIREDEVVLEGEVYHHVFRVLRRKEGDSFYVFNREGMKYFVKAVEVSQDKALCKILKKEYKKKDPEFVLYQCLPKGRKMGFIIEKSVELGVNKIVPVVSQNVAFKFDSKKLENKRKRWNQIAISASEQSGNIYIPEILKIQNFNDIIKIIDKSSINLIAWEHGDKRLMPILDTLKQRLTRVNLIVGSEGGFTEDEIEAAKKAGWLTFTLGGNILRVETAAVSLVAIIKYELGII